MGLKQEHHAEGVRIATTRTWNLPVSGPRPIYGLLRRPAGSWIKDEVSQSSRP